MRNQLILAALSAVLCSAQPQPAQQPRQPMQPGQPMQQMQPRQPVRSMQPMGQPNVPGDARALKAYLGLTDEQLDQMRKAGEAAHKAANEKAKALQPLLEQKHAAVRELLAKGSPDPAALGKAILEVRAIEKQIGETHEAARKGALGALTPEQRTKFKAIEDAALLPEATREAIRLGLTPYAANRQPGPAMGPQPMRMGPPNRVQPERRMQPMPGQPPNPQQPTRPAAK